MIKLIFIFIVCIHGLIHLLGFFKAFDFGNFHQLTKDISRPAGIIWLLAAVLFLITALFYFLNKSLWPVLAIPAVVISQTLIITAWSDAKFGTVANVIVLIVALPALGSFILDSQVKREQQELLTNISPPSARLITRANISHLPAAVQNWLQVSRVMNKPEINFVRLKQKGVMKTRPGGKWMDFTAAQYFDVQSPAFIWTVHVKMMPLVYLTGRDKFQDGEGEMLVKLLSLINVVDEGHNHKMNTGTMLRYLGEICWFPAAAVNDYIKWDEIDTVTAKATMTLSGESVSGIFTFNNNGEMISFEAERYFGARPEKWRVEVLGYTEFNGYRIPHKNKVTWKLKDGDFTWLQLEITDWESNTYELYGSEKSMI